MIERKYQKTHKWLTFSLDLRLAPHTLWMLLGEAASKCEHVAGVPLQPAIANELHSIYLAKGVVATTAIEGNTLTESDVREQLKGKLKVPPSKEYLKQETENILKACTSIRDQVIKDQDTEITFEKILEFNRMTLNKLAVPEHVYPGHVRTCPIGVGNYLAPPAVDCEYLLRSLCDWLSTGFKVEGGNRLAFALIRAIVAHVYIAWIHPFGDGNGRTARLIEFCILLSAGVPSPAAHLLSNHYNQTRQEYYRQLDAASKSGGNLMPFICYATQGFVDGIREQLTVIKFQQWNVAWENFVYELFREKDGAAADRQRKLILGLGYHPDGIPLAKLGELNPKIAKAYASKTIRTIQRDVQELEKMELVERKGNNIRPCREIILAFLPPTAEPPEEPKDPQLKLGLESSS